ncbi:MAG: hypothetical protein ACJAYU_002945 [Bradymonadia bacterium]|jgi:hypothetical protein
MNRGPTETSTTFLPLFAGFLLFTITAGCGDELGGNSYAGYTPPAAGSAELRCRNLTEDVCSMWVECGEIPTSDYNGCTYTLDAELDCDLARDVSFNYQSCLRDLDTGCFGLEIPSSCSGVILM